MEGENFPFPYFEIDARMKIVSDSGEQFAKDYVVGYLCNLSN